MILFSLEKIKKRRADEIKKASWIRSKKQIERDQKGKLDEIKKQAWRDQKAREQFKEIKK